MPADKGQIASHFVQAHWREKTLRGAGLERFQDRRARRMMAFARTHSAYYAERFAGYADADWRDVPPISKPEMMANFSTFNTAGVTLEEAMETALRAEVSRDFAPTVRGVTVGLSSGTSGHRGIFLAHPREQAAWAGVMLARALPGLRREGYRAALFLRSNSNLYERIGSNWLRFRYFDLMTLLEEAIEQLNRYAPDILVAPPSMLGFLANALERGALRYAPQKLFSAAEVLEPQDRERLETVFQQPVHQIYQCTEGLLAITCRHNRLHIQEDLVAIQMERLEGDTDVDGDPSAKVRSDESAARFTPIVTDLWRTTQPIIRYRMNDILSLDPRACPCGSGFRVISAIEGRCDDILYFYRESGGVRPFFPDTIRRMALLSSAKITDYQAFQHAPGELRLHLLVPDEDFEDAARAVGTIAQRTLAEYGCKPAVLRIEPGMAAFPADRKRRRVQRCYADPAEPS